jgi:hypothetical protein
VFTGRLIILFQLLTSRVYLPPTTELWTSLHASEFASLITTLHGANSQKTRLRHCYVRLLGFPRDRYLASPLARWLLPSTDHIENASTILLRGACVRTCILTCCLAMLWVNSSQYILPRVYVSVNNNNGLWIGWLSLLIASFTITLSHNQLQELTINSRGRHIENTSVAHQWIYANHIENTAFSIAVFTARYIATEVIRLLPAYSCRGNVFTESLPRTGLHVTILITFVIINYICWFAEILFMFHH